MFDVILIFLLKFEPKHSHFYAKILFNKITIIYIFIIQRPHEEYL